MTPSGIQNGTRIEGPPQADAVIERLRATERAADAAVASDLAELIEGARRALDELAADADLGPRLALADSSVEVRIVGVAEPTCFSMLMDRQPAEFLNGPYPDAEVRLYMTAADLAEFWAGRLHVAIAIADGRIGYEGPVRKVLRVLPLVRRYAREVAG